MMNENGLGMEAQGKIIFICRLCCIAIENLISEISEMDSPKSKSSC